MSKYRTNRRQTLFAALIFTGLLFLPLATFSQEPAKDAAVTAVPAAQAEAATTQTPTLPTPPPTQPETVPTVQAAVGDAKETADRAAAEKAALERAIEESDIDKTKVKSQPAGKTSTTGKAVTETGLSPVLIGAILIALFVVPVLVGNYLARQWKMPDHGWKFAVSIGVFAASLVVVTLGQFKFGPDLAGGITLIYEFDNSRGDVPVDALIDALKKRVDPTGTREVTIRKYGSAIEIIIPKTGGDALGYVKRTITAMGQLEFRITAEEVRADIRGVVAQAKLLTGGQKDVMVNGKKEAEWVEYDEQEFSPPNQPDKRIVKRMAGDTPEALVLIDNWNVTGDELTSASKGVDERGGPAVHFGFNNRGANYFGQLTGENLPNRATGTFRYLGIVLDKKLISAPSINSRITDSGMISGAGMNEKEVDHIVGILQAGRLPAKLNKDPIRQEEISPTLGAVTVAHGKRAIAVSMIAVAVFMLVYYRFAGLVACLALSFNLLLVLALMVLIKAAFTLPGLAGLALTVGMAVDANVLIYERIREELKSGAALRMAIRNGFNRAFTAIVDSNVTNIITGVALYALATESVKGFAVTLILGILSSMFTAVFFAHVVFDVVERRGWIKNVRMMQMLAKPNYDFLRMRYVAGVVSLVIIAIGMTAAFIRGEGLLDIDFTGGSSVTFSLKSADKMPIGDVRDALYKTDLATKNLLVVEQGTSNTRYSIDTSLQSIDKVKDIIKTAFDNKLMMYSLNVGSLTPYVAGDEKGFEAKLSVNSGGEYDENDGISHDAILERVRTVLAEKNHTDVRPAASSELYQSGTSMRFKEWTVRLPGLDEAAAQAVFADLKTQTDAEPLFPMANTIGGRVSTDMQFNAIYAIFISLLGVIVYLWLRFQKVTYGLAAAAAVIHDVLVTVGVLAMSYYFYNSMPGVAKALRIDAFQISLTIVAALLTILGYSLNDTIVTFDRLREIKGKSPRLTAEMVNESVNQCLGRTLLTSLTVFMVVVILYIFGGEGIHSFAFAFLVGIIAGTYSTIYIAAPILLWLSGTPSTLAEKEGGSPAIGRAATA